MPKRHKSTKYAHHIELIIGIGSGSKKSRLTYVSVFARGRDDKIEAPNQGELILSRRYRKSTTDYRRLELVIEFFRAVQSTAKVLSALEHLQPIWHQAWQFPWSNILGGF